MVVWLSDESLIEGRLFDGDQPRGPKFAVADVNSGFVQGPQICGHETGGFVVTWATYDGDSSDTTVQYRRYDSAGNAVTGVSRTTPPRRGQTAHSPAVACGPEPEGDFVIAWGEAFSDCQAFHLPLYSICGRSIIGDQVSTFRVGAPKSTFARAPSLAVTGGSDFVLTWLECNDRSGCNMFGQRFTRSGPVDCPGDCDRNGIVTIDELLAAVNAALSDLPELMKQCLPADIDLDYRVSVGELVAAVNGLLDGCGQ